MTRDAFARLVEEAIGLIPEHFQREMKNLALVVEDEPSAAVLASLDIEPPDTLYGLYEGTPPDGARVVRAGGTRCRTASRSSSGRSRKTATTSTTSAR